MDSEGCEHTFNWASRRGEDCVFATLDCDGVAPTSVVCTGTIQAMCFTQSWQTLVKHYYVHFTLFLSKMFRWAYTGYSSAAP